MSKEVVKEPVTYAEFLDRSTSSPWLFAFDQERFNRVVAQHQQDKGNSVDGRARARGLLSQQCYGRSKALSDFGHPVPALQLANPNYCGDIMPGSGFPSLDTLHFVAVVVLDYCNQVGLTPDEQMRVLS